MNERGHIRRALHVGAFYYWNEAVPVSTGWPLLRLEICEGGLAVRPWIGRGMLKSRPDFEVSWDELAAIEAQRHGIRLVFKDGRKAVSLGSPFTQRLRDAVRSWSPISLTVGPKLGYWEP